MSDEIRITVADLRRQWPIFPGASPPGPREQAKNRRVPQVCRLPFPFAMTRPLRRTLSCFIVSAAAAALAAACSSQASPTAPSSAAGSSSGVTILGQVAGSSTAERAAASTSNLTVSVVGTSISTQVQGNGKFTLENVPPGDVSLQFKGPGTNAKLTISGLSEGQQVQITVSVNGSSAAIESEQASGPGQDKIELEGLIASIDTAGQTLVVNGKTVSVPATAAIRHGGTSMLFTDLQVGQRVHVKGTMQGTQIVATEVNLQNQQTSTGMGHGGGD
jgi:hypothetical protein